MRSSELLTVPIELARASVVPLHEQLVDALRAAIGSGALPAGSRLPSTRTLAELLGVSRGVTVAAYERLFASGAIYGAPGSGTYVSVTPARRAPDRTGRLEPATIDLRPGQVCTEGFPLAAWRAAWRQASYDPPPAGPAPGNGLPELRAAVAEHVRRVHGHAPAADRIVITAGPRHALDVLLRTFGAPGPRSAVADPCPRWLRDTIAARGMPAVPVPLDVDGIRVAEIPGRVDAVLVAPDGDTTTAVRTPVACRQRLADRARRHGGWLVELGRDAPADRNTRPLPSLLTLGPPDRTALLGDLGPLLTPTLGLGYLVLPSDAAATAAARIAAGQEQPPLLCQRAAAELFRGGHVAKRRYQLAAIHARKIAMVRAMLEPATGLDVVGAAVAGHAIALLPRTAPVRRLIDLSRQTGIRLGPLHEHYARSASAPNGLLLGFGQLDDNALRTAMAAIVELLRLQASRVA